VDAVEGLFDRFRDLFAADLVVEDVGDVADLGLALHRAAGGGQELVDPGLFLFVVEDVLAAHAQ
jgi:hypothetical protein